MIHYKDFTPEVQAYVLKQNKLFVFVNFDTTHQAPWLSFVRAGEFPEAFKMNMDCQKPVSFVQWLGLITIDDLLSQTGPLGIVPLTLTVKEPAPTMTEPEHLAAYLRDHGYEVTKKAEGTL